MCAFSMSCLCLYIGETDWKLRRAPAGYHGLQSDRALLEVESTIEVMAPIKGDSMRIYFVC